MIIGIDPGINGGVAWDRQGVVGCENLRSQEAELCNQIENLKAIANGEPIRAFVEKVHAMPKQSVVALWTFAENYGKLLMALYCHGIPVEQVAPQTWQKAIGATRPSIPKDATQAVKARIKKEGKDNIKAIVCRAFPNLKVTLNTADALGILMYGRKQ